MRTNHIQLCIALGLGISAFGAGCVASTDSAEQPLGNSDAQGSDQPGGGKADFAGSSSCSALEDDPYVLTGVSKGGEHEGSCLDTTVFRAAREMRGNEYVEAASRYDFAGAQYALDASIGDPSSAAEDYALVANVKHDGAFWVAEIPLIPSDIEAVYYLVEEFKIPVGENLPPQLLELLERYAPEEAARIKQEGTYTAAHGMLRITFRDDAPVVVKAQYPADPSHGASFHELVLSVHAVSHVPGEYDPAQGMVDAYGTARGVYSLREKVDVSVGQLGNTIKQWRLDLDGGTIRQVLRTYVSRSTERGLNDPYNTLTRNCGSELFEAMEEVLGRSAGFDVRQLESIDDIQPASLTFPTLGRNYPKYAEQGLVGLKVLPLIPGESPDQNGYVTHDQIEGAYRVPTLNDQVQQGTVRLD